MPAGVAVPTPPDSTRASTRAELRQTTTFSVSTWHASVAGPCFYLLCLATLPTRRQLAVWALDGARQVGSAIRQGASLRSLAFSVPPLPCPGGHRQR